MSEIVNKLHELQEKFLKVEVSIEEFTNSSEYLIFLLDLDRARLPNNWFYLRGKKNGKAITLISSKFNKVL